MQTEVKDREQHTEEKLCAFIVKCVMMLHSESNKTESQLGTVIHKLYKKFYDKELDEEQIKCLVQ